MTDHPIKMSKCRLIVETSDRRSADASVISSQPREEKNKKTATGG